MRKIVLLACAMACLATSCVRQGRLPRADLARTGIDTSEYHKVIIAVTSRPTDELHSLMVVKGGEVIYERYQPGFDAQSLKVLWSASKSFTSTAIGLAIGDGKLRLDDKVVSFFTPEELPDTLSDWLQQMTVEDLLKMSSGFKQDHVGRCCSGEDFDWAKTILATEQFFEPGTLFSYNSMNSYLLSAIFSRATGEDVSTCLKRRVFAPLGIREDVWTYSPQGIFAGGWGLFLSTESLAKMGLLYARDGVWKGRRILPEGWAAQVGAPQILQDPAGRNPENDWAAGYGYHFWTCRHGFRMDGAHGQLVIILPEKDAVIVLTGFTDAPTEMNAVWQYIYPTL